MKNNGTKPLTATWLWSAKAFIYLNREGKVSLDDPLLEVFKPLKGSEFIYDMVRGVRNPKTLEPLEDKLLNLAKDFDEHIEKEIKDNI